ncbi:MAG TPA: DUF2971 domain-containing protein [Ideonella sp.]|uniref:DUF2971 domain-containing protein n=1 Tax=Ideonella sp. TaxID=1929293 RepID=UPI002C8000C6|nr:DUF2971 domain-containing protein [Ideonella sp.]HSI47739.1 DUF2971 domain-containing protein [Ideonella sp.]
MPDILYHYTSVDGLLGILRSGELWATHLDFLNDSSEGKYAHEVMWRIFNTAVDIEPCLDSDGISCLHHYQSFLENKGPLDASKQMAFTVSLTEAGDLLSQWRGYCPPGGGISIGLDTKSLAAAAAEQQFSLVKCVYHEHEQRDLIQKFVVDLVNSCKILDSQSRQTEFAAAHAGLLSIALQVKHPAFQEEKEWRLVKTINTPRVALRESEMNYRAARNLPIPYLKFKLPTRKVKWENYETYAPAEILIGPCHQPDLSAKGVEYALQTICKYPSHIIISKIPFKT